MSVRLLFLGCCTLLALGTVAEGKGRYQHTRDNKTLVWNNASKAGESAAWDGDRDPDGYATGFGTLTWYTAKSDVYARYFGNMIHGKFDGAVNAHASRKTAHAIFIDGKLVSRWTMGPAPSRKMAARRPQLEKRAEAKPERAERPAPSAEPTVIDKPIEGPGVGGGLETPAPQKATGNSADSGRKRRDDDFLRALMGPPASLRSQSAPSPSSAVGAASTRRADALLTKDDATELANAHLRISGYDLGKYQSPRAEFAADKDAWLVVYERILADETSGREESLSVVVDNKTKKTTLVTPK